MNVWKTQWVKSTQWVRESYKSSKHPIQSAYICTSKRVWVKSRSSKSDKTLAILLMAANTSTTTKSDKKTPKKANLLDHNSIKHILDESVSEVTTLTHTHWNWDLFMLF